MSPLRARHILFFICTAVTVVGVRYFIPGGPTPVGIYAPVASAPLSPPAGLPSASTGVHLLFNPSDSVSASDDESLTGVHLPFNPSDPVSAGDDESLRIAYMEKSDTDLFWKNVEDMLALSMREGIPGVHLLDWETRELIENIRAMRESFINLRQIHRTPENAAEIMTLVGRLDESSRGIREVMGMSTAEFLNRLTKEGIDNDKPEEGDVVLEYLDPPDR